MSADSVIASPSLTIHFSSKLIAELNDLAMQGFTRYPWGGQETGGVLFGTHDDGSTTIAAYRPLDCEHAEGPAFVLSEKDEEGLQGLIEAAKLDPELEGLDPVGWYHSAYEDLYVTRRDLLVQDRHFPEPWKIVVIVRRIKSEPAIAGFYVREGEDSLRLRGQYPAAAPVPEPELEPETEPVASPLTTPEPEPEPAAFEAPPQAEPEPELPPAYERIIRTLLAGIHARKGFLLLAAEPGAGKQELLAALMNRLECGEILCAHLLEPASSVLSFFEQLSEAFGLECSTDSKPEALYALNDLLTRRASQGRATVLIVDEAERLPAEVLHEIRMFEMLQSRSGKLLQVILCGSPKIAGRLDEREFIEFKQQVGVRCILHGPRFVKYN